MREFYALNENGQPETVLARLKAVKLSDWESEGYPRGGLTELLRSKNTVLAGEVGESGGAFAITLENLKRQLYIIE